MNDLERVLGYKVTIKEPITMEDIAAKYEGDIVDDKNKINEHLFAKCFTEYNELRYHNSIFYNRYGQITEEMLSKDIYDSIVDLGITTSLATQVKKLLDAVKLCCTVEKVGYTDNVIPFHNGDLYIREREIHLNEYRPSPYRLDAELHLDFKDLQSPNFDKWLHDLLSDDDIATLQEFIGYCLIPTTKAQKSLFLVGQGGAGKSVIGVILECILGKAMLSTANTQEFVNDKFKLPELENKLVLYDDDLDSSALENTGLYKKLITNTISINCDRKYGQPFNFTPCAKLVSCCNEMLTSNTDATSGFYRRLLPLQIKPISNDFKPDLHFYDKIRSERDAITVWALQGLNRLIANNWVITESARSKEYLKNKAINSNHVDMFIDDVFITGITVRKERVATSDVIHHYKNWCRSNSITQLTQRQLQTWLLDNGERLGIKPTKNVKSTQGTLVRGYIGLKFKDSNTTSQKIILSV